MVDAADGGSGRPGPGWYQRSGVWIASSAEVAGLVLILWMLDWLSLVDVSPVGFLILLGGVPLSLWLAALVARRTGASIVFGVAALLLVPVGTLLAATHLEAEWEESSDGCQLVTREVLMLVDPERVASLPPGVEEVEANPEACMRGVGWREPGPSALDTYELRVRSLFGIVWLAPFPLLFLARRRIVPPGRTGGRGGARRELAQVAAVALLTVTGLTVLVLVPLIIHAPNLTADTPGELLPLVFVSLLAAGGGAFLLSMASRERDSRTS